MGLIPHPNSNVTKNKSVPVLVDAGDEGLVVLGRAHVARGFGARGQLAGVGDDVLIGDLREQVVDTVEAGPAFVV